MSHQRFSQSDEIIEDLKKKEGGWRNNISELGATVAEVKDVLKEIDSLDDFVSSRLTFVYDTHKKKRNGSWKQKRMTIGAGNEMLSERRETIDAQGEGRELTLNDLYLKVRCEKCDKRYEDVSCDSEHKLRVMPEIGRTICEYI